MPAESDFWILLVNLSARVEKEPREKLLAELQAMSLPTQAVMLRRLRRIVAELAAIDTLACESSDA
jgi:hypothetical protein